LLEAHHLRGGADRRGVGEPSADGLYLLQDGGAQRGVGGDDAGVAEDDRPGAQAEPQTLLGDDEAHDDMICRLRRSKGLLRRKRRATHPHGPPSATPSGCWLMSKIRNVVVRSTGRSWRRYCAVWRCASVKP